MKISEEILVLQSDQLQILSRLMLPHLFNTLSIPFPIPMTSKRKRVQSICLGTCGPECEGCQDAFVYSRFEGLVGLKGLLRKFGSAVGDTTPHTDLISLINLNEISTQFKDLPLNSNLYLTKDTHLNEEELVHRLIECQHELNLTVKFDDRYCKYLLPRCTIYISDFSSLEEW